MVLKGIIIPCHHTSTWWVACNFSHVYSLWISWRGMRLLHTLIFHMLKPAWSIFFWQALLFLSVTIDTSQKCIGFYIFMMKHSLSHQKKQERSIHPKTASILWNTKTTRFFFLFNNALLCHKSIDILIYYIGETYCNCFVEI